MRLKLPQTMFSCNGAPAKLGKCPERASELRLMMSDETGHIVNEFYPVRNCDGLFDIQIDVNNDLKSGI
jgi:hypothetical protein